MPIIIYATHTVTVSDLPKGQVFFRNPQYWRGEVEPAETVVVYGEYPELVEAYKKAGIDVEVINPDEKKPFELAKLTKAELIKNLESRGIQHEANSSKPELLALLEETMAKEAAATEE